MTYCKQIARFHRPFVRTDMSVPIYNIKVRAREIVKRTDKKLSTSTRITATKYAFSFCIDIHSEFAPCKRIV
jgi:hypothetical protein